MIASKCVKDGTADKRRTWSRVRDEGRKKKGLWFEGGDEKEQIYEIGGGDRKRIWIKKEES